MKMHEVAKSNNDEYYTPLYAIEPICEYIKPNSTIWCPFDIEERMCHFIRNTCNCKERRADCGAYFKQSVCGPRSAGF